jgi:hypothetical protein
MIFLKASPSLSAEGQAVATEGCFAPDCIMIFLKLSLRAFIPGFPGYGLRGYDGPVFRDLFFIDRNDPQYFWQQKRNKHLRQQIYFFYETFVFEVILRVTFPTKILVFHVPFCLLMIN